MQVGAWDDSQKIDPDQVKHLGVSFRISCVTLSLPSNLHPELLRMTKQSSSEISGYRRDSVSGLAKSQRPALPTSISSFAD